MKLTILSILLECEHSRIMQKFCWNEFTFIRKMHQTRIFFAFQRRPWCENIDTQTAPTKNKS